MFLEVFFPEWQRASWSRVRSRRDLSRSGTSRFARIRERCHHRTRLRLGVRVVQMVNRNFSVHQHGLLDHAQTHDCREKINIFLGPAGTSSDVVDAPNVVLHCSLPFKRFRFEPINSIELPCGIQIEESVSRPPAASALWNM